MTYDYRFLEREFRKYGINDYQHSNTIKSLDSVFGFNEKNHRYLEYGVDSLWIGNNDIQVDYYNGSVFQKVCAHSDAKQIHYSNERKLTPYEEKEVWNYCISLIENRKAEIERNQYWLVHFDEFVDKCFELVKKYVTEHKKHYQVELYKAANSIADKRVAPSIAFCQNGWQVGYIKIFQNNFGDISFDIYRQAHLTMEVDTNDIENDIESACSWIV